MRTDKERELFERSGIVKAVFSLAFPTMIGQIILVIYNMADTYFVGLSGNDTMLTAVTVCMPAFMFLSAISNLFGVGGASVIARALGRGKTGKVRATAAFSFYGCLLVTMGYSLLAYAGKDLFVDLLGGTDPLVHANAVEYLVCTVVLGGCATSVNMLLSHLIRAEGRAICASAGIALGGFLNILLDPLFMFVLLPPGREALGAAAATALANLASLVYFTIAMIANRRRSCLSFRPRRDMVRFHIPVDVFSTGLPACVMTLFENISYAVLDKLMSLYGVAMQAGIGVAKKVNMLAHCSVRGIAQGALPLIGYTYASGDHKRMREAVRVTRMAAIGLSTLCMVVYLIFAKQAIGLFIHRESPSLAYGAAFLRILCVGGPFSAGAYTTISFFQAAGEGRKSFLLAILRKGIVDIPLMFLMYSLVPVYGIVAATPLADGVCCYAAHRILAAYMKNLAGRDSPCLEKG